MNVVILAAGFGTRMAGVIGDIPKALIQLDDSTLLDHLLARIRALDGVARVLLVSNHRFAPGFARWRADRDADDVEILDDGADAVATRLGAIGDLDLALRHLGFEDGSGGASDERASEGVLVLGADNLLGFGLTDLVEQGRARGACMVAVRRNPDPLDLSRRGNARIGDDGRVLGFVEKPESPIGPWSVAPLYYLTVRAAGRVREYLEAGGHTDAPGHFIAWLHSRERVFGWEQTGPLLDVGNPDSWAHARARMAANPERYSPS